MRGDYRPPKEDMYRERDSRKELAGDFQTKFHLESNDVMRLKAARDQGRLLTEDEEEWQEVRVETRLPFDTVCPKLSSKWENQLARLRVAVDQREMLGEYAPLSEFQHRDLAVGKRFVTNFTLPQSDHGLDGKFIEPLIATELRMKARDLARLRGTLDEVGNSEARNRQKEMPGSKGRGGKAPAPPLRKTALASTGSELVRCDTAATVASQDLFGPRYVFPTATINREGINIREVLLKSTLRKMG